MGTNPAHNLAAGLDAPVEQVSWNDCQGFISKMNQTQTRWKVRLPTEAEWEYACRAGSKRERYGKLDAIAWYEDDSKAHSEPVGKKQPNAFGLYDMLGNVWQWCNDWFAPYPDSAVVDPKGPPTGEKRIMRGGCYYCEALHARASRRNRDPESHLYRSIGLRIAAEPRPVVGIADSAAVH
jgi:formylglycine-generating enzyme required for sulfatase activity